MCTSLKVCMLFRQSRTKWWEWTEYLANGKQLEQEPDSNQACELIKHCIDSWVIHYLFWMWRKFFGKWFLVCWSDSKINGLTDHQWPQNMVVNGLISIYFPMPPFFSCEPLCLKQDQALSWVLDFCPPCFQDWKLGFIQPCCVSDASRRAWIRLDEWRWERTYIRPHLISLKTTNSPAGGNI